MKDMRQLLQTLYSSMTVLSPETVGVYDTEINKCPI